MEILQKARLLADYVEARWSFISGSGGPKGPVSENMGAILVDAVFQAGLNYRTVVLPRVRAVVAAFPALATLGDLEAALDDPRFHTALNWRHPEKPGRLRELTQFLRVQGLETIGDIQVWLGGSANRGLLLSVRGVGPKTVDYLSRLLGIDTIAVDRHARRLLRQAGILSRSYAEAKRIIEFAADLLRISRWSFDKLIWDAMTASTA